MEVKYISLHAHKDFAVLWEVLDDKTTVITTDLFEINVNHVVNEDTISEVVNQIIVELFSDSITIH
jgi:hypothetical protein